MRSIFTKEYEEAPIEEAWIINQGKENLAGRNISEFKTHPAPFPRRFAKAEDWPNNPVKMFQDP